MIYTILYISSASEKLERADVHSIMDHAKNKNSLRGISGFLIYKNETFIQMLEGEKQKVDHIYSLIQEDPRHNHVIKLTDRVEKNRSFEQYHSAFEICDDRKRLEKFKTYVSNQINYSNLSSTNSLKLVLGLLKNM